MNERITILTEPATRYYEMRTQVKNILGRDYGYGGHSTVTKSLLSGLSELQAEDSSIQYNYRPWSIRNCYPHVHVLAGVKTLQWAIKEKKKGNIQRLTAGPNIVVFPTDADGLVTASEIDELLLPSDWNVRQFEEMSSSLKGRIFAWPAGVDEKAFDTSDRDQESKKVLLYCKGVHTQFATYVSTLIKQSGFEPIVLTYGSYTLAQYQRILRQSKFMISLDCMESEGIFLLEAWAMDVPTVCFDPRYFSWTHPMPIEREGDISSCPYLTPSTGLRFMELSELKEILLGLKNGVYTFSPRKWVLENMTNKICAQKFLEAVRIQ